MTNQENKDLMWDILKTPASQYFTDAYLLMSELKRLRLRVDTPIHCKVGDCIEFNVSSTGSLIHYTCTQKATIRDL